MESAVDVVGGDLESLVKIVEGLREAGIDLIAGVAEPGAGRAVASTESGFRTHAVTSGHPLACTVAGCSSVNIGHVSRMAF